MFPADFISGSRDFTQHLTSGELILIHSADACILVKIARAREAKNPFEPFRASLRRPERVFRCTRAQSTHAITKGPGKRGHIVADTLLPMMFLGLRKLGNICCGHKMFLNKIRNIFVSRTQNLCCARGQTAKRLCRQQCVRNNVSSFARALRCTCQLNQY